MNTMRTTLTLLALLVSLEPGCALMSKGTALSPRFFSPEAVAPTALPAAPAGEPLAVRLGLVEAASHLEERMSYRVNASELGYYEERRWTERPDEYLRRALERELFERRHLRRVVSGAGTTLDVELTAFEELRGPAPRVRLALRFTLHDDRQSTLEKSLVVERALGQSTETEHAQLIASALGAALTVAVSEVGDDVARELAALPRAPTTGASDLARGTSAPTRPLPTASEVR
jgi:cholesterol transport system auxiliary component